MTIDRHHLILYGAVFLLSLCALVIFYESRFSTAKLEAAIAAKEQLVAAADARMKERELAYEQRFAELEKLKATPATTPKQIVEHILDPRLMQWATPPKVDAPAAVGQLPTAPGNLILDPANQRALNDRLVVCKQCEIERDKLKLDLGDTRGELKAKGDELGLAVKELHKKHYGRTAKVLAIGAVIGYIASKIFHF